MAWTLPSFDASRSCLLGVSLVLLSGCGGGRARDADAPLSAAAAKVDVTSSPKPSCKKLGTVKGVGEELDESVADAQATRAVKEEAARLGGDTAVLVTTTNGAKAGAGGTVMVLEKTADVFVCAGK